MGKTVAKTAGYSPELCARICAEISAGESIKDVTRQPGFPSEKTHYRWMAGNAEYREAITAAMQLGVERYAADTVAIADEAPETSEGVAKARLRIDIRKWHLAKLLPKKYGDQLTLAGDKDRPLTVTISPEDAGIL